MLTPLRFLLLLDFCVCMCMGVYHTQRQTLPCCVWTVQFISSIPNTWRNVACIFFVCVHFSLLCVCVGACAWLLMQTVMWPVIYGLTLLPNSPSQSKPGDERRKHSGQRLYIRLLCLSAAPMDQLIDLLFG